MKTASPVCTTLFPWLRANLGKSALAPLTGSDSKALAAAVQIVDLFSYSPSAKVAAIFGDCVRQMQPHVQYLAFHAIAHVMDWADRERIWSMAGLIRPAGIPMCANEPGGANR